MKRETLIWLVIVLIAGVYIAYRVASTGLGVGYDTRLDGAVFPSNAWDVMAGAGQVSLARTVGIWIAALPRNDRAAGFA